jgi:hypothetical protein
MSSSQDYKALNDVDIDSIVLKSDQGGEINIHPDKVKHISIFEDIYSPFMSGYLRMVDAHNLINHFPIIGQETVEIKFRTPGFDKDFTTISMEVYGIDGRTKSQDFRSEIMDLKLMSKDYRLSKIRKVSKAFTGDISSMVTSIVTDYLSKNVVALKTKGEYKFVIPNWEPVKAIDWLSKRSISDSSPNNSNYLFFERQDGFLFTPMGELTKQSPKYAYDLLPTALNPEPGTPMNAYKQFYNIQDVEFSKQFDRLEELDSAMYSSNLLVHDIVDKDYTVTANTYIKSFDKISTCEKYPLLPLKNRYSSNPSAINFVASRHTGLHTSHPNGQDAEEWFLKRQSSIKGFDTNVIKIVIAGNSSIKAGDMLRIRVPSSEPSKKNDPDWFDKRLTGKYLATAVRHKIDIVGNNPEYTTVVEASRDSIPIRTPDESSITIEV